MRTSDRGSAVVEFLLLVLPLIGLGVSTLGVVWYSFAKAQLSQIAAEAAMMAAEPDSSKLEVSEAVAAALHKRLNVDVFNMDSISTNGVLSLTIELPPTQFLGPMALVFPELGAVSNAPIER